MSLPVMLALMAGLSIPMGAVISSRPILREFCTRNGIDSFVSAFGGGALLAAIALVLVPHGVESSTLFTAPLAFLGGGLLVWGVTVYLRRVGGSAFQFMAMMLDFIPESIVLGASSAAGSGAGYLLAGLIALQNMPEGFASWHEMSCSRISRKRLVAIFLLVPLAGPLAALLGQAFLTSTPSALSFLMLFCSGAILYLIFEDIAPSTRMKHSQFPAVGAVCGFMLGIVGYMVIHA